MISCVFNNPSSSEETILKQQTIGSTLPCNSITRVHTVVFTSFPQGWINKIPINKVLLSAKTRTERE